MNNTQLGFMAYGRFDGKGKEEVGYFRKQALDRDRRTAACAGRKAIFRASRS
jgi:hypothetical protein